MPQPFTLTIRQQSDIEQSRRAARTLALAAGCERADAEAVVLAVSELATNLLRYAQRGTVSVSVVGEDDAEIRVESRDEGPGIPDLALALCDGYSTGGGLGSGLPGVKRLMDDFRIESEPAGTLVVAHKRCRR